MHPPPTQALAVKDVILVVLAQSANVQVLRAPLLWQPENTLVRGGVGTHVEVLRAPLLWQPSDPPPHLTCILLLLF